MVKRWIPKKYEIIQENNHKWSIFYVIHTIGRPNKASDPSNNIYKDTDY